MFKYEDLVPNTNGTYPDTESQDVTSPGAGNGTPFLKPMIDDNWGANQALMDHAGLIPDGVQEANGLAERLLAMQRVAGHPGECVLWWGEQDPAVVGARVMLLEGQFIDVNLYPDLAAAVYIGDANNDLSGFLTADGAFMKYSSPILDSAFLDTAGPWMYMPDARGMFLRGSDDTLSVDIATRFSGSIQAWGMREHGHGIYDGGLGGSYLNFSQTPVGIKEGADPPVNACAPIGTTPTPVLTGMSIAKDLIEKDESAFIAAANINGWETRPINMNLYIGVRY
jgi:hypothetical protein